jgi:hypothetical protein
MRMHLLDLDKSDGVPTRAGLLNFVNGTPLPAQSDRPFALQGPLERVVVVARHFANLLQSARFDVVNPREQLCRYVLWRLTNLFSTILDSSTRVITNQVYAHWVYSQGRTTPSVPRHPSQSRGI